MQLSLEFSSWSSFFYSYVLIEVQNIVYAESYINWTFMQSRLCPRIHDTWSQLSLPGVSSLMHLLAGCLLLGPGRSCTCAECAQRKPERAELKPRQPCLCPHWAGPSSGPLLLSPSDLPDFKSQGPRNWPSHVGLHLSRGSLAVDRLLFLPLHSLLPSPSTPFPSKGWCWANQPGTLNQSRTSRGKVADWDQVRCSTSPWLGVSKSRDQQVWGSWRARPEPASSGP